MGVWTRWGATWQEKQTGLNHPAEVKLLAAAEDELPPRPDQALARSKLVLSCGIPGKRDVWQVNLEMG